MTDMNAKGTNKQYAVRLWHFYADGFRNMTWGRVLWWIILLKVVILFGVLRIFFFRPNMAGKTDTQKSEIVGHALTHTANTGTTTNTQQDLH